MASEAMAFLNDNYQSAKEEMERWASFDRHGEQGYLEEWKGEILEGYVTQDAVHLRVEDENAIGGVLIRIFDWPLTVRMGRIRWTRGLINKCYAIFKRRHEEFSTRYVPMIKNALEVRRTMHTAEAGSEEEHLAQVRNEIFDEVGIGELYDAYVMNGHWHEMTKALRHGLLAWWIMIGGAAVGAVSALIALLTLLASAF